MISPQVRHKLVWGWLRLLLGTAQMMLSVMGVVALVRLGLHPTTLILVGCASTATLISRLLYRGKAQPDLPPADTETDPGRSRSQKNR